MADCYKSEFTHEQMRHIDANVATWMERKHRGSWRWLEQERLDNRKTREFFESIIKRAKK